MLLFCFAGAVHCQQRLLLDTLRNKGKQPQYFQSYVDPAIVSCSSDTFAQCLATGFRHGNEEEMIRGPQERWTDEDVSRKSAESGGANEVGGFISVGHCIFKSEWECHII